MKNKSETKKRIRRERWRIALLTVGGFLASVAPPATLLLLRWDRYTAIPAGGVRLTVGGILIAAMLLLKVMGKLKLPSRMTVMAIALILSYLLEALLSDLSLVLWAALIGEALDALVSSPLLSRARARLERLEQADVTAVAMESLLHSNQGRKDQ